MTLRDYQIDISDKAAVCLYQRGLVYLAMETRTGKTITAFEIAKKSGAKKVLFVTKKKAIASVQADYSHYDDCFSCVIINYESVDKFKDNYDLVIIDEAHSTGAFPKPSKRAKTLKEMAKNLPIIYLSGTPTPEGWSQLYHQLWISSYSPFKDYRNFYAWAKDYVVVKPKYVYNRQLNDYSGAISEKIEPIFSQIRFTQTQTGAGFTEAITEQVLKVPMSDVQQKIIKRLIKDRIVEGQSGRVILGDTAVKIMSKTHQLCSGTVKTEDGSFVIISDKKAQYIKQYFSGRRVAVFYKFQAEFEMLKTVLPSWTDSPEDFQGGKADVFLGQFQSAREGIRLDTAEAIVFITPDFSALSYLQAKDRIVSKERKTQAVLYWVFSIGGIEEKIYQRIIKKKDYTLAHFKHDFDVRGSLQA